MAEFNGFRVRKVAVRATVYFEAYVKGDPTLSSAEDRIEQEIADAVEYRAVHLKDTEDHDALIALVRGGSNEAVLVAVMECEDVPGDFTDEDVQDAVDYTACWL